MEMVEDEQVAEHVPFVHLSGELVNRVDIESQIRAVYPL